MAKPPDHLSPSGWAAFEQCPKKWAEHYVYGRDEPASAAMEIGTFAHAVLEKTMEEAPARRTEEVAHDWAARLWAEPGDLWADRGQEANYPTAPTSITRGEATVLGFKRVAWYAIRGLWALERPAEVDVVATEREINWTEGVVPMVAVVDRLDRQAGPFNGGLRVVDYKSGTLPEKRYRDKHERQIVVNALAVASLGKEEALAVAQAGSLLYVSADKAVHVPTHREARSEAHEAVQAVWEQINRACETEVFPAKASALCSWCSQAATCREGYARVKADLASGKRTGEEPGAKLVAAAEANRAA